MSARAAAPAGRAEVSHAPVALAWRRLRRNRRALAALAVLVAIVLAAAAAPLLPLADPNATQLGARLLPPLAADHPLGTDHLGRDILARLIWGARTSLAVALVATAAAAAAGSLIGLAAGYRGGLVDTGLMRLIDVLLAFPYLLLALAIVAALGPGLLNALIAIAVANIPFFARTARGATVAQMGSDYVAAARISGLGGGRILLGEVLPNVLPAIVTAIATTTAWMILETAGLSFLGLGAQPPDADLGSMLADGRQVFLAAPHVATLPGFAVVLIVLCVNLIADYVRDALDPRLAGGQRTRPAAITASASDAGADAAADAGARAEALLDVRELTVRFAGAGKSFDAVDGVSFAIAPGERVGLAGASGSGKSVLALALLRLVPSPPGRIAGGAALFAGEDLVSAPLARLQEIRGGCIGYVFQDPAGTLNPLIPVGRQVVSVLRRHRALDGAAARAQVADTLARMRFDDPARILDAYPHELSGGQIQRVGIAMAVVNRPALLIADEPTTALDMQTQAEVLDLLDSVQRETGAALLFITHDLSLVGRLCERLMVMRAGRIVEDGAVGEVMRHPRAAYTRELIAAIPRLRSSR